MVKEFAERNLAECWQKKARLAFLMLVDAAE